MSGTLVASVRELKLQITAGDGRNVAGAPFRSGMFPQCWRRGRRADARPSGRRGRMGGSPSADRGYFVSTGKTCYRLAADHELAEFTQQRPTLLKLSGYFEVYLDALNELSERYVTDFDFNLIADKMLDRFNLYRRTGDDKYREEARPHAAPPELGRRWFAAPFPREPASNTNDSAGDAPTTATVLGQGIVHEGLKNVAAGANPMALKRGIEKGAAAVVEAIKANATPVTTRQQMAQIAAISANNDQEIGDLIGEVMEKVGKDGVITVEESKGVKTEVEYVEGMNFDRGYISPYFVTNPERMECEIENPYILVTDKKLSAVNDILPVLERVLQTPWKDLLVICEDCDGEALPPLAPNRLRGALNVCAVKAPGFGDRRKDNRADLATISGAQLISEEVGRKLDAVQLEDLGRARKVVVGKEETTIIEGHGS